MSSISVGSIKVGHYTRTSNGGKYWANGRPDSAGGVDVEFLVRNNTEKTIKYMSFYLTPYNQVNDAVSSKHSHQNNQSLKFTEPLEPSNGRRVYWKNCWYNNSIVSAKLDSVEIEYMDGTKEKLEGYQIERSDGVKDSREQRLTGCLMKVLLGLAIFGVILLLVYLML